MSSTPPPDDRPLPEGERERGGLAEELELVPVVDLSDPQLPALLELAVGGGDPQRLSDALRSYADGQRRLLGAQREDVLVAVLGHVLHERTVVIAHLAVRLDAQGGGIGRRLLAEVADRHPDVWLEAETDTAAVGFYRQCGFTVHDLGERYPGVHRFRVRRPPRTPLSRSRGVAHLHPG